MRFLLKLSCFAFIFFQITAFEGIDTFGIKIRINHYDPPYMEPIFVYKNRPELIINILPKQLVEALSKELRTQFAGLLKFPLEIYTIAWRKDIPDAWPVDKGVGRVFYYRFHEIVNQWMGKNKLLEAYGPNVLMGLFEPFGVEYVAKADSMPFEKIAERNVTTHPVDVNKPKPWNPQDILYSPSNTQFKLKDGRNIATFWTTAISPDKTKAIIVYNILILDDEVVKKIAESVASRNLETVANKLEEISKTYAIKEDAIALEKAGKTLKSSVGKEEKEIKVAGEQTRSVFFYPPFIKEYKNYLTLLQDAIKAKNKGNAQRLLDNARDSLFRIHLYGSKGIKNNPMLRFYFADKLNNLFYGDPNDEFNSESIFNSSIDINSQELDSFIPTIAKLKA